MSARPSRRLPPLVASTLRVFNMSFGPMLWSRRTIFLGVLAGGPLLMGAALRAASALYTAGLFQFRGPRVSGETIFGAMIWLLYVRFIVPILGVFYGTSLIADEVDDKTLTYLFVRPIQRRAVLFGKYLASLACTMLLLLPSVVVLFFLVVPMGGGPSIGEAFPALLSDLLMLAAGTIAYGAVFALTGARVRKPLAVGLVFALGWEPVVLVVPGYLKQLTVAYYLQGLVLHPVPQARGPLALLQAFQETPAASTGLVALAAMTAAALWAAGVFVEEREYVLDQ